MTRYKHYLKGFAFSMAFVALMGTEVHAQVLSPSANSNSNSNSTSGATSRSGSSSRAVTGPSSANTNANQTQGTSVGTSSGANVTLNSTTSPNTTASNTDRLTGGTSNTNQVSNSGYTSSDNIVRAAPTVYAPPVSGGSPCSLGYSAGASFLGWGAAAGGQVVDSECERRMHVAMLFNAGWKGPAKELACNNKEVYFAFRSSGEPCVVRPDWEGRAPAPAPMVQQQPVPVGPQPVVQRTTSVTPPGRFVCMDAMGRIVKEGTPGASCGQI